MPNNTNSNNYPSCPINNGICPKESLINSIAEYIELERDKHDRRQERWQVFINSLVGSFAVLIFSGLIYIGKVVIESFKH